MQPRKICSFTFFRPLVTFLASALAVAAGMSAASGQSVEPTTGEITVHSGGSPGPRDPSLVAAPNGDFTVGWEQGDTYLQRFSLDGSPTGALLSINGSAHDIAADVLGDYVVVWDRFEIFGTRRSASGIAQGAPFQVNTTTNYPELSPEVARSSDGEFVVTWVVNGLDGDSYGVFGQRFDAAGNGLGGEFQVNTQTANSQASPDVSVAADGSFVIVWNLGLVAGNGVFGRRYSPSGHPQGEFRVDDHGDPGGRHPAVSHAPDGDFVVTWEAYGHENGGSSSYGVFARRFTSGGQPVGGSFSINQNTLGDQEEPVLAHGPAGGFLVAWTSQGQDGDQAAIFARYYGGDGSPGNEFQVNIETEGDQMNPAITSDIRGLYTVAWESGPVVTESILARRFQVSLFRDGFESGGTGAWSAVFP